jgi:outer membrane protein
VFAGIVSAQQSMRLTLAEAKAIAIKNHPLVLAARDEVSTANQEVREARSAYYPTLDADLTGSQANANARIGAGYLTDSRIFDRFGQGVTFSQLVTDAGRTKNLVASSRLHANASDKNYQATKYDVLLQVERAFFDVLRAQATVRVAQETVAARKVLSGQVTTLANNKLKSQLDVTFSNVAVSEAQLLLIRAQEEVQKAFAELARAMGSDQATNYELADEPAPPNPPDDPSSLIVEAENNRPELASLRFFRDSSYKFAEAEKDLNRPTVSIAGVAGFLPLVNQGATQVPAAYEGVAVNVQIPIFNGHLFAARREAAQYRALEADQRLRGARQRVAQDVRVSWAGAITAFQRLDVTAQFKQQASLALDLAQGRYDLGLSSIVELTQAQLNLTQAEIEQLNAKYDYQSQYAQLQYSVGLLQ